MYYIEICFQSFVPCDGCGVHQDSFSLLLHHSCSIQWSSWNLLILVTRGWRSIESGRFAHCVLRVASRVTERREKTWSSLKPKDRIGWKAAAWTTMMQMVMRRHVAIVVVADRTRHQRQACCCPVLVADRRCSRSRSGWSRVSIVSCCVACMGPVLAVYTAVPASPPSQSGQTVMREMIHSVIVVPVCCSSWLCSQRTSCSWGYCCCCY